MVANKRKKTFGSLGKLFISLLIIMTVVVFGFVWRAWQELHQAQQRDETPVIEQLPQNQIEVLTPNQDNSNIPVFSPNQTLPPLPTQDSMPQNQSPSIPDSSEMGEPIPIILSPTHEVPSLPDNPPPKQQTPQQPETHDNQQHDSNFIINNLL